MKKSLLLLFMIACTFSFSQEEKFKRIAINNPNDIILKQLNDFGVDLQCGVILKENKIQLELSENELERISEAGIFYNVLIDDLTEFYSKRSQENLPRAISELNSQKNQSSVFGKIGKSSLSSILNDNIGQYNECDEIDWAVPANFKLGSMGGCFTVSEALAELDLMRSLYPNLISAKTDASPTGQTTIEGRTTYYVRISDNPDIDESGEPETLYTGMTHSREVSSLMNLMYYMWYILENYSTDPAIKNLVDNQALYFIPIVNSDGLAYNESVAPNGGGLQRKNRNIYSGSCSTYTEGVDLNRNFGYYWNNGGSSSNTCNETYRGPSYFSEPETQIIRDFFLQHDFELVLNHHSFKNAMLHGYAGVNPADLDAAGIDRREDEFAKYNHDMTHYNRYAYGPSTQISALNSGNTNDWMMGPAVAGPTGGPGAGKGAMAWTPENGSGSEAGSTGSGFWPNPIFIDDIAKRAMRANFLAAYYSGSYAKLIDLTSSDLNTLSGNLNFGIEFLGQAASNFTLTVTPVSSNITSIVSPSTQSGMTTLEQRNVSAAYTLNGSIQPNDQIEFKVTLSNSNYVLYEANITKYYNPTTLISDNPDSDALTNWTQSGGSWGTTNDAYSGSVAITDSPSGSYSNNESKTLQLNTTINTANLSQTIIQYYAKWDLERSFDYVQIEASTNGSSWIPLCATYTKPGAPNANNTYSGKSSTSNNFQPDGEPLYDGDTQDKWVMEEIAIDASENSAFNNQATVYLRFNFNTDSSNRQDSYTTTFDGFIFDDFKVLGVETPCVLSVPTGVASSSVTATAATITWDNIPSANYDLRYKETSSSTWINVNNLTSATHNLTGLTASTSYEVQIRSKCGANDSAFSSSTNFTTTDVAQCTGTVVSSFPYNESFEGSGSGGLGLWTNDTVGDDINWITDASGTPSNNTGPSSAQEGSYYIFVEASGNGTGYPNKRAIISSPCFDLSGFSEASFSFAYHMYGASDMGTIDLEISTDNGSTWSSIWNELGNKGNSWFTSIVNLTPYVGGSVQLRFNRFVGSTWQADIAIDNLSLTGIEGLDTIAPVITLVGAAAIDLNVGDTYTEQGATASDNIDGDITANIVVGGDTVNPNAAGTYVVTYNVSDAAGNAATEVTRTVNVIPDTTAPVITLVGAATINLNVGDTYTEQGATVSDNIDGDITANIVIGGDTVNTNTAGTYVVTYNVSDAAGNAATEVTRTVNVIPDTTAPVITLVGAAAIDLNVGDTYTEQGATASDNIDGDITANIVVGGDVVNTNVAGTYVVTYNVSDAAGNAAAEVTRTVNVIPDTTAPVITLVGAATINLNVGDAYTDQGATANDNIDGDITANIVVGGDTVNTNTAGTYVVTYNVSDAAGNAATEITRTVNVIPDTTAPVITLVGAATINLNVGDTYTEQGATASDNIDGDITANIVIGGDIVNTNVAGTYNVTYNVSDNAGNAATEVIRTVNVLADTTAPVITLNGASFIDLNVGDTYTELGATALDNIDGDITANIVITDNVNTSIPGTYFVNYNVTDASGNMAATVTRTVNVSADTVAPIIALVGSSTINLNVGDTYVEQGATASDNIDGDISANVVIGGDVVDTNTVGTYVVTYNVNDATGNAASQLTRTVNVSAVISGCTGGISTFPYSEGFENTLGGWTQSTSDDLDWLVDASGTPSNNTGPSSAVQGSYYIFVEASGNNTGYPNKQAILNSPCFDLSVLTEATFSFKYHMFGDADMGTIDLEISTDEGVTWTSIWSQIGNKGDSWQTANVDISAYTGGGVQLRFNRVTGGTWKADIAVDDVSLTEGGVVVTPCSGGITSYPYTEGFENTLGAWTQSSSDDIDWTVDANGTPSNNTGPSSAIQGSYYIYVEASGNATPSKQAIINSPCYDLSGQSSATFSFNYHMYGSSDMGTIALEASNDNGVSWTSIWIESGNKGNSWQTVNIDLSSYVGSSVQLRFNRITGGTWQADIAIDNINLTASSALAKDNLKEKLLDVVDVKENNELTLYPNPVESILSIKTSKGGMMTYRIINVLGQVVETGKTEKEVIVDSLEAGMYYIEVTNDSDKMMKRFIKE